MARQAEQAAHTRRARRIRASRVACGPFRSVALYRSKGTDLRFPIPAAARGRAAQLDVRDFARERLLRFAFVEAMTPGHQVIW